MQLQAGGRQGVLGEELGREAPASSLLQAAEDFMKHDMKNRQYSFPSKVVHSFFEMQDLIFNLVGP